MGTDATGESTEYGKEGNDGPTPLSTPRNSPHVPRWISVSANIAFGIDNHNGYFRGGIGYDWLSYWKAYP